MQKKTMLISGLVVVLGAGAIAYALMQKGETPDSQNSAIVQDENNDISATVAENDDSSHGTDALKEGWKNYSSSKLGISFQYPEKASNMVSGLDGEGGFVPVKVIEDAEAGIIYLAYGPSDTLESLRKEADEVQSSDNNDLPLIYQKPSYGWEITIKKIQDDNELDAFVKSNYGEGCFVDEKKERSQKGVYQLTIKGEDWEEEDTDMGNTTCSWGFVYTLWQATDSNTIISLYRGQEATFDDEEGIINSIKFF